MTRNSGGVKEESKARQAIREEDLELWDGRWVRAIRERKRLMVKDLAERAGVSTGFIQDLEHNHITSPSLLHVLKVCRGLGVPLSKVMAEPNRKGTPSEFREDDPVFQAGYQAALVDMQDAMFQLRRKIER